MDNKGLGIHTCLYSCLKIYIDTPHEDTSWNQMVLNQWKMEITLQILLPFNTNFLLTDTRWIHKGDFGPALQHLLLVEQSQMNAEDSPQAFDAEHLLHALMPSHTQFSHHRPIYCPYILYFFTRADHRRNKTV